MKTKWTTPAMEKALQDELKSAVELQNSRVIRTEEGREITARLVRLIEVLADGAATTPLPARHNQ